MSKFNTTNSNKTTNKCGYTAYKMADKEKLTTQCLCSFFRENKYYGDTSNELIQTAENILNNEPKFVANLARYVRKEMHLRSVSHALTALIAHNINSKEYIKEVVADVVERPDDITEILACYINMFGKPIPNGLKKALGSSIGKFNEYQISKYNGGNKQVKFRDVLRITHPTPQNDKQNELFNKIINDTLPTAERWETELSANGNTKEVWEKLIEENKLGYMAMLRNLRNIINVQPNNINKVYDKLSNKEEVLKSKQLPFRFFSAYREIQNLPNYSSKILDVLETAIEYSVENLPKLQGKTIIAIDTSGSMNDNISLKSTIRCCDIARLIGVLATKICDDYIVYTFNTELSKITFSSKNGIIETAMNIPVNGGGTNLTLPLKEIIDNKIKADRMIMISDNEINSSYINGSFWHCSDKTCQSLADIYRNTINKDFWVHAIDLQGYGTQQFIGNKTNIIAGWSEKVLEFVNLAEEGIDTQVKRIENYYKEQNNERY